MTWRRSDRWAVALLSIALLLLLVVQVTPFSFEMRDIRGSTGGSIEELAPFFGYEIWQEIVGEFVDFPDLDPATALISTALILGSLMVAASPFVVGLARSNRVIWWFLAILSGMVVAGLSCYLGWEVLIDSAPADMWRPGVGLFCMIVFPVFHFAGILCIRGYHPSAVLAPEPGDR